jgi:hypothetical protein
MNYMEQAFEPVNRHYANQVAQQTWGHLAPKRRRYYRGTIIFCHGEYGDRELIRVRFPKLDDSPWLFEGLHDFIQSRKTRPGNVYRFEGTYRFCKNGAHQFSGKVRRIIIK